MKVPILHCETETGRVRKMQITTDLRYARVDSTSRILLDMDGRAFSLVTGKLVKPFRFGGHVDDANPVAPLVFTDTGVERRPPPWRVHVWDLRNDRLLATLPHNPKFKYSSGVKPCWTSDGTYVYFVDTLGENFTYAAGEEMVSVTRIWNVKTGQLVGDALPFSSERFPGPKPATMIMRRGADDAEEYVIHDAISGATGVIPVKAEWVRHAWGDKIAHIKRIDGKPHLCVATLSWDPPRKPTAARDNSTSKPARRGK